MAIMELVIFHRGLPIVDQKYDEIRRLGEEEGELATHALFAVFSNLMELSKNQDQVYLKFDIENYKIHVWRLEISDDGQLITSVGDDTNEKAIFNEIQFQIVDDNELDKKETRKIVDDIIAWLARECQRTGKKIGEILGDEKITKEIDSIIGNIKKTQYMRFFEFWNRPRLGFKLEGNGD